MNPDLIRLLGGTNQGGGGEAERFFDPMLTRPSASAGGGLASLLSANPSEPMAMNYGRRAEDSQAPEVDDTRERLKARLIGAMEKYANYKTPDRERFERKRGKRYDEGDVRKMQATEQAGLEPIVREIQTIRQILQMGEPKPPKYDMAGDRMLRIDPSGVSVAYEPPPEPPKEPSWLTLGQGQDAVRPQAGGGYERIPGPPAKAETPQRPFSVGSESTVYDPERDRWLTPPGGVKPGGLPASVAGRALDAGVVPVPLDDPNYPLYQRVIAGTASKEEQGLIRAANAVWARAYQDRLQNLGKFAFGEGPTEANYADAEAHANRVRSDYMKQAQAGSAQPGVKVDVETRESQIRQEHPEWTTEQVDDQLLAEGY